MPGDYDFELSAEQEARARSLHESSISIDMCSMGPGGPASMIVCRRTSSKSGSPSRQTLGRNSGMA